MYVKNKMTQNPYTIKPNAPISEAIELMSEKNLKRVPVVDNGKVVGVLTKNDLQKVSPTKATSLSIFEINYLLSKTLVKDAMSKDVFTISPDSLLEEAAVTMRDKRVGTLPVVNDEVLVGIITESDILDAFIDVFGFKEKGTRITLVANDVPGALAEAAGIFKEFNANITNIVVDNRDNGKRVLVFRTSSINTDNIEKKLIETGFKIEHVLKNE